MVTQQNFLSVKNTTILLLSFVLSIPAFSATPDITKNRYATEEDAAYWYNVNVGDYLLFTGDKNNIIRATSIRLPVGGKILLYKNKYAQVRISGIYCENTREEPTIVTNFGGQVEIGENKTSQRYGRGLHLDNFENAHLTGKFDPDKQTGHKDYRGHDEGRALVSGDYYEKYGIWVNSRWEQLGPALEIVDSTGKRNRTAALSLGQATLYGVYWVETLRIPPVDSLMIDLTIPSTTDLTALRLVYTASVVKSGINQK